VWELAIEVCSFSCYILRSPSTTLSPKVCVLWYRVSSSSQPRNGDNGKRVVEFIDDTAGVWRYTFFWKLDVDFPLAIFPHGDYFPLAFNCVVIYFAFFKDSTSFGTLQNKSLIYS
jgi:hypothetical protein